MYRRLMFVAAVALVGATMLLASPGAASAIGSAGADARAPAPAASLMNTTTNTAIAVADIRSCAFPSCTLADRTVIGQTYQDFCRRDAPTGRYDLISAGSIGTGFAPQSALFNKGQTTDCANGGNPAFVLQGTIATPRVCPNVNCRPSGATFLPSDGVLRQYCQQAGGTFENSIFWHLVYNPVTQQAGFVPSSRIGGLLTTTGCAP